MLCGIAVVRVNNHLVQIIYFNNIDSAMSKMNRKYLQTLVEVLEGHNTEVREKFLVGHNNQDWIFYGSRNSIL